MIQIPNDFPVKVIQPDQHDNNTATCGTCGSSWDDSISTEYTPAPSGRCPFEYFHDTPKPEMFKTKFDIYVCEGDSIECEINGITYTAKIVIDEDHKIDDDDCHNTDKTVTGCDDEQFKRLLAARKAWFDDEWFYCGIVISAVKSDGWENNHLDSLWGIECNYPNTDNSYLLEVANDLLTEYLENLKDEKPA